MNTLRIEGDDIYEAVIQGKLLDTRLVEPEVWANVMGSLMEVDGRYYRVEWGDPHHPEDLPDFCDTQDAPEVDREEHLASGSKS